MRQKVAINNSGTGQNVTFFMEINPNVASDAAIQWYLSQNMPPEPEVICLMLRVLQRGDLVIDGGANVGFFSCLMAELVGPSGKVIAIEPGYNNLGKLAENIKTNDFKNIEIIPEALGKDNGQSDFYIAADNGTNSVWENKEDKMQLTTVVTTTLDTWKDASPKLIKLDIEGSEHQALIGAHALLMSRVPYIVMEMNAKALENMKSSPALVRRFMESYHYKMFLLHNDGQLPSLIPDTSTFEPKRENTNVLFSTVPLVSAAWPKVVV